MVFCLREARTDQLTGRFGLGEGSEFYRPLAIAIIGGTITSTLLTLLVIPSFYDSIETTKDNWAARWRRAPRRQA